MTSIPMTALRWCSDDLICTRWVLSWPRPGGHGGADWLQLSLKVCSAELCWRLYHGWTAVLLPCSLNTDWDLFFENLMRYPFFHTSEWLTGADCRSPPWSDHSTEWCSWPSCFQLSWRKPLWSGGRVLPSQITHYVLIWTELMTLCAGCVFLFVTRIQEQLSSGKSLLSGTNLSCLANSQDRIVLCSSVAKVVKICNVVSRALRCLFVIACVAVKSITPRKCQIKHVD